MECALNDDPSNVPVHAYCGCQVVRDREIEPTTATNVDDLEAREHWREWAEALSAEDRDALEKYVQGQGELINALLRKDVELTGGRARAAQHLDNIIDRSPPIAHDALTYRGSSYKAFQSVDVGDTLKDSGFMSTSSDRLYAQTFARGDEGVMTEIVMPKGTKAAFVDAARDEAWEHEVLMARGTTMRVVDKFDNIGQYADNVKGVLRLEVVSNE